MFLSKRLQTAVRKRENNLSSIIKSVATLFLFCNVLGASSSYVVVYQNCYPLLDESSNSKDNYTIVHFNEDGSIHLLNPPIFQSQSANFNGVKNIFDMAPTMSCQYRFLRTAFNNNSSPVQQMRLDFNKFFILEGPDIRTGDCLLDTFFVVGAYQFGLNGPLCGNLTGQHMYLNFESGTGANEIAVIINYIQTAPGSPSFQQWDILVNFIPDDSLLKVPLECLQYFPLSSGIVTSMNYNFQQLNNQKYTICIPVFDGMKRIQWSSCGGPNDFVLTGQPPIMAPPDSGLANITSPSSGNECMDWVRIAGIKYCGNAFDQIMAAKPFSLQYFPLEVFSDNREFEVEHETLRLSEAKKEKMGALDLEPLNDSENTGFCLIFKQFP